MKMEDIIEGVSKTYRIKRNERYAMTQELNSIKLKLFDAEKHNYENISVAEHNRLIQQKNCLEEKIKLIEQYCDGIQYVREYLMDLGFDTEVT